jgi:hypothetical protein
LKREGKIYKGIRGFIKQEDKKDIGIEGNEAEKGLLLT